MWEPLISLIQDQKRAIDEFSCGIRCETVIAGDVDTPDMCDIDNGEVNIGASHCVCPVLLFPEHLQHWKRVILALAAADLLGPAVFDEAHCISVWGRKFRHAYMQLSLYKSHVRLRSLACLVRCRILCIVHLVQLG